MASVGSLWNVKSYIQRGDPSHTTFSQHLEVHYAIVPLKSTPVSPEGTNQQVREELLGLTTSHKNRV